MRCVGHSARRSTATGHAHAVGMHRPRLCATTDPAKGYSACFTQCGLFREPTPCQAFEGLQTSTAPRCSHCVPGPAEVTDCSSSACVTGKICIQKICKPACRQRSSLPRHLEVPDRDVQTVQPTKWNACNWRPRRSCGRPRARRRCRLDRPACSAQDRRMTTSGTTAATSRSRRW